MARKLESTLPNYKSGTRVVYSFQLVIMARSTCKQAGKKCIRNALRAYIFYNDERITFQATVEMTKGMFGSHSELDIL